MPPGTVLGSDEPTYNHTAGFDLKQAGSLIGAFVYALYILSIATKDGG